MGSLLFLVIAILVIIAGLTFISYFKAAVLMAVLLPLIVIYWLFGDTPRHNGRYHHHED
jgi:hypothetical protein